MARLALWSDVEVTRAGSRVKSRSGHGRVKSEELSMASVDDEGKRGVRREVAADRYLQMSSEMTGEPGSDIGSEEKEITICPGGGRI